MKLSTEQTPENIQHILAILSSIPGRLEALSGDAPFEPPGPNERTFPQVLAHLINCEARTTENITLALFKTEPTIPDIHPERQFGSLFQFERMEIPDLLAYFRIRRQALLGILNRLKKSQWERRLRQPGKQRLESVYWLARSLALHEQEHMEHLSSMRH